jgi:hypothetical protein
MTDGTGVNYPFHEELWPQLEQYFAALSQTVFSKYQIPRSAVKVIRIGMDKTGEFNYPYSEVHGGGVTNNTWWAFDSDGSPYRDYPAALVSATHMADGLLLRNNGSHSALPVRIWDGLRERYRSIILTCAASV